MKAAKTICIRHWMKEEQTKTVMDTLNEGGQRALFVGGCVRNALLGEEVSDIDIATQWTPQEAKDKLEAIGVKVVPTGIDHGTITAVNDGKIFEVTTLRKDVETDGRRAVVAFTDDWVEDAHRRDFTMNTLLADAEGNIYDPTGQGIKDLEARRVVFVGKPEGRIAEDYLRILRFFRFHALYGKGDPEDESLKACAGAAGKIATLSKERITQEFFKIMSVDEPVPVLDLMFEHGVLKDFDFKEYDPDFLKHLCDSQLRYNLGFLASRLLVLAGLSRNNAKSMERFLLFPKVFIKDIEAISQVLRLPDLKDDHAVKVAVYKYGRVPTAQALMIELANDQVMNGYAPTALDIIQNWDVPTFPITGEDLIKEGIKPGPELGQELERREQAWIDRGFATMH